MRRPTVSEKELAKVAGFLKALDLKPVSVRVCPSGEVDITLSGGEGLALPMSEDEIEHKYRHLARGRA